MTSYKAQMANYKTVREQLTLIQGYAPMAGRMKNLIEMATTEALRANEKIAETLRLLNGVKEPKDKQATQPSKPNQNAPQVKPESRKGHSRPDMSPT
jgi:hypothetical protein